jgi:hypothetical protein
VARLMTSNLKAGLFRIQHWTINFNLHIFPVLFSEKSGISG